VSVVGDANIDSQIATAGRVRQVVDDLDISALLARARGDPLCLIASFYLVDRAETPAAGVGGLLEFSFTVYVCL
jgi:hypothetical protein